MFFVVQVILALILQTSLILLETGGIIVIWGLFDLWQMFFQIQLKNPVRASQTVFEGISELVSLNLMLTTQSQYTFIHTLVKVLKIFILCSI